MPGRVLSHGVEAICIVLMAVLCVDVFLGVFSRYVLGNTFVWYDEVARACFVWLVFLGAAVGVRQGAHFRFHLLIDRVPAAMRRMAAIATFAVLIGLALLLVWQGWILVQLTHNQRMPVMGWPRSVTYLAVPVGGVLMVVYLLPHLYGSLVRRDGQPAGPATRSPVGEGA
jgi:TRAP-type C4-dicarboxylate transport system permease small subunit